MNVSGNLPPPSSNSSSTEATIYKTNSVAPEMDTECLDTSLSQDNGFENEAQDKHLENVTESLDCSSTSVTSECYPLSSTPSKHIEENDDVDNSLSSEKTSQATVQSSQNSKDCEDLVLKTSEDESVNIEESKSVLPNSRFLITSLESQVTQLKYTVDSLQSRLKTHDITVNYLQLRIRVLQTDIDELRGSVRSLTLKPFTASDVVESNSKSEGNSGYISSTVQMKSTSTDSFSPVFPEVPASSGRDTDLLYPKDVSCDRNQFDYHLSRKSLDNECGFQEECCEVGSMCESNLGKNHHPRYQRSRERNKAHSDGRYSNTYCQDTRYKDYTSSRKNPYKPSRAASLNSSGLI
jgi:hypothetical protein